MFDTGEFTAAPSSPHADAADTPLAEHPPGAGLAAALAGVDLSETSDYALVEVLRAVRRMTSWAQAIEQAATAELVGRPGQDPEFAADEIAAALTLTRVSANRQVSLAWELGHRLPATRAALSTGAIDLPKARTIADAASTLDPVAAHDVELAALERASDQTTGQLRARTARLAARVDPYAAARRHEKARRQRRVALEPGPDGTADLCGLSLPADDATAAYARVDACALAARGAGDARTMDELRADAYLGLLLGSNTAENGGSSEPGDVPLPRTDTEGPTESERRQPRASGGSLGRIAGTIHLTVPLTTLAGLADEPGELGGYGPVTADIARKVAARATRSADRWCWSVTDPDSGEVLHHGRTSYRPTRELRDFTEARDHTCRAPGCRQPATRCDLDHTVAHEQAGATCPCNLGLLCRHHHRMKHEGGWRVHQPWPGAFLWTSPTGHTYTRTRDAEPP